MGSMFILSTSPDPPHNPQLLLDPAKITYFEKFEFPLVRDFLEVGWIAILTSYVFVAVLT